MAKRTCMVLVMLLATGFCSLGRTAEAQDAKAIIDKAIKALGGEETLGKIKAVSFKVKGTISFGENENPFTSTTIMQGIDHSRQELEGEFNGNAFKAVTVVAGEKGTREFGGNGMEMDKDAVANQKRTNYLTLIPITLLSLRDKEFKMEAIAEEKVGDKPAVGIKVTAPDKKDFKLYFDKESGLPVKMVAMVAGFMGGEFTQETTFSDYKELKEVNKEIAKEFGGIKKATKIVYKRDGMKFMDQQITEFKILDKVEPKTFTATQ